MFFISQNKLKNTLNRYFGILIMNVCLYIIYRKTCYENQFYLLFLSVTFKYICLIVKHVTNIIET